MTSCQEGSGELEISLKLFVVLSKAFNTLSAESVRDMKRHGLSPSEFTIMELLYHKGRQSIQQIGDKILVTSGSMTYNIDKLENKGYIRRVPCPQDRRVTYAEMTDEGTQLLDRIFPLHADVLNSLMSGLTTEEKLLATGLLKKLGKEAKPG